MASLQYYKIPTVALAYPRPFVSMLPVLDIKGFSLSEQNKSIFCNANAARLSSGRVAILHALQCIGITETDTVLVPAYHCMSMIEPVLWLGARVKFYQVDKNLCPFINFQQNSDLQDVKAVIIPHFFGFMQDITKLCDYFNKLGIAVIEDCAHAFFGERDGKNAGESGDYSITSTVKFFPGTEGGVLYSARHALPDLKLTKRSLYQQLKAAKNIVEQCQLYHSPKKRTAAQQQKPLGETSQEMDELCYVSKSKLNYLDPQKISVPLSWADSLVLNKTSHDWIVEQRRENYQYLAGLLKGLNNATLIFPDLLPGTVPYVLPLLIHKPELHFSRLKIAGVPLWRWEELIVNDCPISNDYRLKLIQLPIHQSLSTNELDWIAQQLWQVLSSDS